MIKFKVGDKVRIKQWLDMPERLQYDYGINTYNIGGIGVIDKIEEVYDGINIYKVIFNENDIIPAFEPELEPFVKVGEQLLLFDL